MIYNLIARNAKCERTIIVKNVDEVECYIDIADNLIKEEGLSLNIKAHFNDQVNGKLDRWSSLVLNHKLNDEKIIYFILFDSNFELSLVINKLQKLLNITIIRITSDDVSNLIEEFA